MFSYLKSLDVRLNAEGDRLRVNAPKGSITDDLRAEIAERKPEILAFLRLQAPSKLLILSPIPRRSTNEPTPLSFAQERLWFLEQLEPGNSSYNICRASRLTGRLNIAALEASLTEIVRRHEVLRTAFQVFDGRPVQVTVPTAQIELPLTGLGPLTETRQEEEVQRRIKQEAERLFDFSAGLCLRGKLLRLGDEDHILILTTHHIISDAWSMGILTRELWTLYKAYALGEPSPLEENPIQYADYAIWQREWLQGDVLESQLSYWKKQLDGIPILNLPTDRSRPIRQSFLGARVQITLPQSLTARINELSNQCGVTPFMTLLAAFQLLLYRYCGQEDVVVGSPIANRSRAEIESLIGFFVNTLVLRTDLSGNLTFKELLLRVRDVCLDAYAHQDLPFEKLVEELKPERDMSRNPLFQVMFVLQNTPRLLPQSSGLSIERIDIETETSAFDLSLYLRERDGRLIGFFEFNTDLVDRSTVERMIGHFQTLLEAIVANPGDLISTLPLLTEGERHQLLVEWNDTHAEYPKDKCIHELFEAQVERTPESIALEFEGKQLTYRELNIRANQLAHYLHGLGVGPEKLVGICVERSLEMVIGLLGILKAGGAYVPLDPTYPKDRLAFMLEDARVSVLLTQKPLVPYLPRNRASLIYLEDLKPANHQNKENIESGAKPDSAAYVIYTSGSTGTPKGVIGLHQGATNRFAWMWRTFPFESDETGCIKTSLSFVDSVWEVFGTLLRGIPTTIIPGDVVRDPERLIRMLGEKHVTRIVLVPSLLRAMLDENSDLDRRLPNLRIWTCSGESLPIETAECFRACLPNRTLLNLYGPSEVSADVTCHSVQGLALRTVNHVGRPISNTQVYILDSNLQLVPIGVHGELCISGAGLARGYLNRAELTAERFVANPFAVEPGVRLFQTGDIARYASDGEIEFLGRSDRQIKIRGYRVELGEIEVTLKQHPLLKDCVIEVPQCGPSDEKFLAAYVVPNKGSVPSMSDLRDFLKSSLPNYMIPAVFVTLDALPLTSTGKIDRVRLPPLGEAMSQLPQGFAEPHNEVEELIAQIWREVLKREKVGVHENFFDLGGHSLLAAQVASRLRTAFRKHLPLRIIFEEPTIAGLGKAVKKAIHSREESDFAPIVPVSRKRGLPILVSQEPYFEVDQLIGGASFFNMPYAYTLSGPLDVAVLKQAIQEIMRRHDSLRTVFAEVEDRPTQTVRRTSTITLRVKNLSRLSSERRNEKLKRLSEEDAGQRFNLRTGPLLRTKLLRLEENEHILLVTMHHIVTDQWSMGVFRSELEALYGAYSQGQSSPLPELSLQFGDFVVWQKRLLELGLLRRQISYWKKQLAEPLSTLDFQKGHRRRRKRIRFRSARQPIEIDVALFEAVKRFARRENSTTFMVFATALMILLHLLTGERDIRISTLVANRNQRNTEGIIGYFVNMLILRNYVSPEVTVRQLLKEVRNVCLSAYTRQDLPFDYLESLLENEGNKTPLCQVMLNYRNFPTPPREICGLTIASWSAQSRMGDPGLMISRLDMMIHLRDASTKLTGAVNYKTDIFAADQVARMMSSFSRILNHLSVQPESRVVDCSVFVEEGGRII